MAVLPLTASAVVFGVVGLLVGCGGQAASKMSRQSFVDLRAAKVVRLPGEWSSLIADGTRVVITTQNGEVDSGATPCYVSLWVVGTVGARCVEIGYPEQIDKQIALAGTRSLWIETNAARESELWEEAYVRDPFHKAPLRLGGTHFGDTGQGETNGGMAVGGEGDLLVLQYEKPVAEYGKRQGTVQLFRVAMDPAERDARACPQDDGTTPPAQVCIPIVHLPAYSRLLAVDRNRILVARPSDQLLVLDAAGRLLRTEHAHLGAAVDFDFRGNDLAVLGSGHLDVYDTSSELLLHRFTIPTNAPSENEPSVSLGPGTAVYSSKDGVHLVRLADGAQGRLRVQGQTRGIAARFTNAGLFYLYATGNGQRIAFIRRASFIEALDRLNGST